MSEAWCSRARDSTAQLVQVLLNLVVNAVEATSDVKPTERRVEVRATLDTEDGRPAATVRALHVPAALTGTAT